jgi:hypothetical protein
LPPVISSLNFSPMVSEPPGILANLKYFTLFTLN